jgi:ribosomal-protein-alanine N-acetyltransferase
MPHLQTPRLTIVPFTAELAEAAIKGKSALEKYLGVSVATGWPIPDLAEALPEFVAMLRADPLLAEWMGSIIHREEKILIGDMGFKSRPNEDGVAEIGYGIVPIYQGKGYCFEAVSSLVAWGWQQPELKKITAECDPNNFASIRVLEKLGMKRAGVENNLLKWELWRPV